MTHLIHLWDAINIVAFADSPGTKSGHDWREARVRSGLPVDEVCLEETERTFRALAELERAAREGILTTWGREKNSSSVQPIPEMQWQTGSIDMLGKDDVEDEPGSMHPPIFSRGQPEWYGLRFDKSQLTKALVEGSLGLKQEPELPLNLTDGSVFPAPTGYMDIGEARSSLEETLWPGLSSQSGVVLRERRTATEAKLHEALKLGNLIAWVQPDRQGFLKVPGAYWSRPESLQFLYRGKVHQYGSIADEPMFLERAAYEDVLRTFAGKCDASKVPGQPPKRSVFSPDKIKRELIIYRKTLAGGQPLPQPELNAFIAEKCGLTKVPEKEFRKILHDIDESRGDGEPALVRPRGKPNSK